MNRRVVIYARFSTDMQRTESADDQVRCVIARLEQLHIPTDNVLILKDEAQSGTKSDREQFQVLVQMVDRGEVAVLAVDDQARLSRGDNASAFVKDLVFKGGRFISTSEGIDTQQQNWDFQVKMKEFQNTATIKNLSDGVRRGQQGRVLEDGSAGDFPFGYESYFIDPDWARKIQSRGPKPKKGLRIFEDEASWVRTVFNWFVIDRRSIAQIARELTRLQVPKGRKSKPNGWHHGQVQRMLSNQKYVGIWAWGKTKTIRNSRGRTKQVPTEIDKQVHRKRPALRIIEDSIWNQAQEQLKELKIAYGKKPGQRSRGPRVQSSPLYPRNILSGILKCGECGANMWIGGSGKKKRFRCPNLPKGSCSMATFVPVEKAGESLLRKLVEILSSCPEWLETTISSMRASLHSEAAKVPEDLKSKIALEQKLCGQIENIVNLIGAGDSESPALRRRLDVLERQQMEIESQIESITRLKATPLSFPDDRWIKSQLQLVVESLKAEKNVVARILHQVIHSLRAIAIIGPGKKRGFARLLVQFNAWNFVKEVVVKSSSAKDILTIIGENGDDHQSPVFEIDLGSPTRMESLGPIIAELRAQGVKWEEVCRQVKLGSGPAYVAWKRFIDSAPGQCPTF